MFIVHVVNKVCVYIQFVVTRGDGWAIEKWIKGDQRRADQRVIIFNGNLLKRFSDCEKMGIYNYHL